MSKVQIKKTWCCEEKREESWLGDGSAIVTDSAAIIEYVGWIGETYPSITVGYVLRKSWSLMHVERWNRGVWGLGVMSATVLR